MSLVHIRTVTDLNRVLSIQQIMARKARLELTAIADGVPNPVTHQEEDTLGAKMIEAGKVLLAKYAAYPTISEFNATPGLELYMKWGETFGVSALFGDIILHHIRTMQEVFCREHRRLVTLLMKELNSPNPSDVVNVLTKAIRVDLSDTGKTPQEQANIVARMMSSLVEIMLLVLVEYALVEHVPQGYRLTPTGKRMLLHLIDVQLFIQTIMEAHKRLQGEPGVKAALTPQ
jgi:hypothetical protein